MKQAALFSELPEGFRYQQDFLSRDEEAQLLERIRALDFQPFDFHGYIAKRRIVEYGWEYDFRSRHASSAPPVADFLLPVRARAADFLGAEPGALAEAVVTEYPPGAPIGWHRDVPQFEAVVGLSLASAARMRFKPYRGKGKLVSATLEPRSIYVMEGAARWEFQHSMPPVKETPYSITFRTLREKRQSVVA